MKKPSKLEITAGLQQFLRDYPAASYLIAFSGGLDSHVLLHSLAQLRATLPSLMLRAIHIDHGLQAESSEWVQHCQSVCAELSISLRVISLQLQPEPGKSTEALAREARYQVFAEHIAPNEILLTAHHQDDQAETLLLNLLRGAGPAGLAAMPVSRPFCQLHETLLCRPLLGCSRQQLATYAHKHQLRWIDDPSNQSTAFDRNYLRHEILPRLQERWPAVNNILSRAAQWQAENQALLSDLLQQQLTELTGSHPGTLSVGGLLVCEPVRQKALLRQWLRAAGFSMPSAVKLAHIRHDVLLAKADAKPCVSWQGCEIRRYRDDLYAVVPFAAHDPAQVYVWAEHNTRPLLIPALGITLSPELLYDFEAHIQRVDAAVTVRFRQGGERLLMPSGQHISLKKFMQDKGIPPWQRARIPLVCAGCEIIIIPGYFTLDKRMLVNLS